MSNQSPKNVLLTSLHIQVFSPFAFDVSATNAVRSNFNVHSGFKAGRFNKALLPQNPIEYKEIKSLEGAIRREFYAYSLEYSELAVRIMPVDVYLDWLQKFNALRFKFDGLCEHLYANWDRIIEDAEIAFKDGAKGLFKREDYPSLPDLKTKFGIQFSTLPFPEAAHLGVSLPEEELSRIKSQVDSNMLLALDKANNDLVKRLYDAVLHLSIRASSEGILRTSTMSNLTELLKLIPKMNFKEDPKIAEFTQRAEEKLTCYSASSLRDNDALREKVADDALDISTDIAEYFNLTNPLFFDNESQKPDVAQFANQKELQPSLLQPSLFM